MKRFAAAVLAASVLAAVPVFGEKPADRGKALFEEKCIRCHALGRALSQTKDREGWEKTVQRMREKGCQLEDAEAEAIVGYLAKVRGPEAK